MKSWKTGIVPSVTIGLILTAIASAIKHIGTPYTPGSILLDILLLALYAVSIWLFFFQLPVHPSILPLRCKRSIGIGLIIFFVSMALFKISFVFAVWIGIFSAGVFLNWKIR